MTDDEKRIIVDECVEKLLLRLPDVIGSLITNHAEMAKLKQDFYAKNPDLQNDKELISTCIMKIEMDDLSLSKSDILEKAASTVRTMKEHGITDFSAAGNIRKLNRNVSDNGII